MAGIHINDIESAINWWRERSPSPDGVTACAPVRALAEVYALMVYFHETECDEATMPRAAVHRDLLDQPRRRRVQGLRPHLRRGAGLDGLHPGAEAGRVAAHHPGGTGLALQSVRRARRPGRRA
jgi:hypothetical protein